MRKPSIFRIGLMCLLCMPAFGAGLQSQEIIQNVEKKLSEKQTVTARFEELYVWKLTGEKQTIKGEFNLKGENRFRITTDDQLIVSDGKTLWTYSKPAGRVLIDKVENAENDWLPQKLFLKTRKDFRHRLSGEETLQGRKCYVIDFDAENEDSYITKMKVWVDAETWLPGKIEQTDISRNKTIYTLSEIKTGPDLEDSLFEFKPPEGVEIIDLR
jgi:outer membrane lipoprotein carrier protein